MNGNSRLMMFMIATMCAVAGCSSKKEPFDRKPTVQVKGTVLSDGQPAAGAILTFMRTDGADANLPGAQGTVAADGTYELTTYTTKDGVIVGNYQVSIVWPSRADWWNAEDGLASIDKLKGKYGPGKSSIEVTIKEGQAQVDPIELN